MCLHHFEFVVPLNPIPIFRQECKCKCKCKLMITVVSALGYPRYCLTTDQLFHRRAT